jgi:hypothetical protein
MIAKERNSNSTRLQKERGCLQDTANSLVVTHILFDIRIEEGVIIRFFGKEAGSKVF